MPKTREQIITDMCYTQRHDFGLEKTVKYEGSFSDLISAGMTITEREFLWSQMAQLFDNCIAPYMEFKRDIQ